MSFVKLHKVCSDFAVGLDSVNQALANNRAVFDQLDAWHAVGNGFNDWMLSPGRHDDPLIARTVADFYIDTTLPTPAAFALVSGPAILSHVDRVKEGQWKIYANTQSLFAAKANIKGVTAGIARDAMCFISMETGGPYVTVSTWNVAGGVLADYDFSLVLWAESITAG